MVKRNYILLVVIIIIGVLFMDINNTGNDIISNSTQTDTLVNDGVKTSIIVDRDRNKILDELEDFIASSSNDKLIPVRVRTRDPKEMAYFEEIIGVSKIKHTFTVTPGFSGLLYPWQIELLSNIPDVVQVEYDRPIKVNLDTANYWFGTQKARSDFGIDGNTDGSTSYSKDDVVIAVIDTGIDASHVDLDEGKVIGWKDYVNGKTSPYDDNGHGTHCSSIIAGDGDGNSNYKGVAPGAALVGVKVLDSRGSGSLSDVEAGVQWAIDNRDVYGIDIISMSLGSSGSSDGTDSLSQTVNSATDNGIVIVVAAGNEGPSDYTIGSPAAAAKAITVGAVADVGEDGFNIASFSSRGPTADGRIKPDICAPGYQITAADAGTTNGYVTYSGTSMATPFVSGVAALMLEENPTLTPTDIKDILMNTARDFGPTGLDVDFGAGLIDGYEAIDSADTTDDGSSIAIPDHVAVIDTLTGDKDSDDFYFDITTTDYPISVTLIMTEYGSGIDFDLYLYDPSGTEVGKSIGTTRQELVTYSPTETGTYRFKAYSYSGSGSYAMDISAGMGTTTIDDPPTASIIDPLDGDTIKDTYRILVSASDDNSIASVELSIDSGSWIDITANTDANGNYYYDWDTTTVTDGSYTISTRATDDAGQVSTEDSITISVKNTVSSGSHTITQTGTVSSSSPDVYHTITVLTVGYIDITLSWGTSADLDFYVYDPSGNYIGRAYTLNNPETLRVWTEDYGTGEYTIKVNLYSGDTTSYELLVEGYERQDFTGTVSSSIPTISHYITMPYTGSSFARLSWSTSADLDFYVYDESGNYVTRAYTTNNPEELSFTVDATGDWRIDVDLYSGDSTDYLLSVFVPEANLS